MLYKQINQPHFDITVNSTKDKGTILHFLCHTNKMADLLDVLLKKKI